MRSAAVNSRNSEGLVALRVWREEGFLDFYPVVGVNVLTAAGKNHVLAAKTKNLVNPGKKPG